MTKLRILSILFLPLAAAHADTFGSGANTFTMDFVTIGNPGNAADTNPAGYGSVGYTYRMGIHEVSNSMLSAFNALRINPQSDPQLPTGDVSTPLFSGANKPSYLLTWNAAARFVNWLNTSKGYSAAYNITTTGLGSLNDNITLWTNLDAGYDAANPFRNSNAHYFLPSENEWYKAAYYDPNKSGGAGYWDYATGSNTAPTAVAGGIASGTAVYNLQANPADVTNAGGLSPYGTMAQNGNQWEWCETGFTAPNNEANEGRVIRGGNYNSVPVLLPPSNRYSAGPSLFETNGFRVASVPEPSALLLTLIGTLGVVTRRRR